MSTPSAPSQSTDRLPLSILDLATVGHRQSVGEALAESTTLAQKADQLGRFERLWFAEHHNMASIASAATSVLLTHIAAHTERIRVGSGGVMLPNHSPLVIAEQFGTLAELYPDRIDLGLGRAPGTDQRTWAALRRDPRASDRFPQDVVELQGYLAEETKVEGIEAVPGKGTNVPLYILGSSLFGAKLAAALGLPYAFASHFAPDALKPAVQAYRAEFRPSEQLESPYVIAALNVVAADSTEEAKALRDKTLRARAASLASRQLPRGQELTDDQLDFVLHSPLGEQARHMMTYTAVGDAADVADYLQWFRAEADADELMFTNAIPGMDNRLRALEIVATID